MKPYIFDDLELVYFPIIVDNSIETIDELSYKPKLIT